ncbi:MAG: CCA tRNA nucleotidyltransferase [Chloroflexota bacterium]
MNVLAELERWLPAGVREPVERVGLFADERGLRCCLVGGPVRDLLLGEPGLDLDIVVEGNAVELAQALASAYGVRVVVHRDFGTATVEVGVAHIDLVTARAETYERPGALPTVRPGTIEEDLFRRDFSMNAMAVLLSRHGRGDIVDPHSGRRDLEHGILRVLHGGSFIDDATRMLRGVRYEQRFGFSFDPCTLGLLGRDMHYLETISGDRVRHEFERTFDEAEPQYAFRRLDTLGALAAVDPALRFGADQAEALRDITDQRPASDSIRSAMWCVLGWYVAREHIDRVAARLNLPRRILDPLKDCAYLRSVEKALAADSIRPSQVVSFLSERSTAALLAARRMLAHPSARERVNDYLEHLRFVRTSVNGTTLIEMGFPQGPSLGHVLERIRAARLDGEVSSRAEELQLARSLQEDMS